FCIECYHCKGSELTEARCADNYTLQTCGSSPDGKAYNACFSHNITYNMPIFGIRYKEEKGCTIAMEHCDFLRTIYCGDDSNVVVNCSFNCCDNNRCNLGHLTPVDGDPTTPDEMTSRFPMDPRTFPSYRASSTQQTQSSTDHEMKTPIVESKGCELHSELWLKILFSLIVDFIVKFIAKVRLTSDNSVLALVNPFQNIDKGVVLQECRVFNETPINVRKCIHILTKILYLTNQGAHLGTTEATEAFFAMTKLFQSKDLMLRRMVYLAIKELASIAEDVIIVTSSLTKDMTGKEDMFRGSAIRALCKITDV
ncbi:Coatomer subunit gamma-2, partial [Exaiptasia diaphana]